MPVTEGHWTDYLEPDESVELDDIQLGILQHKEAIAKLRARERKFLDKGTSRLRRACK